MINLLIKMADSLDQRGLHKEASKVDLLIKKIAEGLENDFHNGIMDYDGSEDYSDEAPYSENEVSDAYEKLINKRLSKGKKG